MSDGDDLRAAAGRFVRRIARESSFFEEVDRECRNVAQREIFDLATKASQLVKAAAAPLQENEALQAELARQRQRNEDLERKVLALCHQREALLHSQLRRETLQEVWSSWRLAIVEHINRRALEADDAHAIGITGSSPIVSFGPADDFDREARMPPPPQVDFTPEGRVLPQALERLESSLSDDLSLSWGELPIASPNQDNTLSTLGSGSKAHQSGLGSTGGKPQGAALAGMIEEIKRTFALSQQFAGQLAQEESPEQSPKKVAITIKTMSAAVSTNHTLAENGVQLVTHSRNGTSNSSRSRKELGDGERLARLAVTALEACWQASQVRALRAAADLKRRQQAGLLKKHKQLTEARNVERQKSFVRVHEVDALRRMVADLKQHSREHGTNPGGWASSALALQRAGYAEAMKGLAIAKAKVQAQGILQEVFLAAVAKVPVQMDSTDAAQSGGHGTPSVPSADPGSDAETEHYDEEGRPLVFDLRRRPSMVAYESLPNASTHGMIDRSITGPNAFPSKLAYLREWLSKRNPFQEDASISFEQLPPTAAGSGLAPQLFGAGAKTVQVSTPAKRVSVMESLSLELIELFAGVLAEVEDVLVNNIDEEVWVAMEHFKTRRQHWDPSMLSAAEKARVLREGINYRIVDATNLASYLGQEQQAALRQGYMQQWVEAWLGSYLDLRKEAFQSVPQSHRLLRRRGAEEQHNRQCGRLLVDGMRHLFYGRGLWLQGVDGPAASQLLRTFAATLSQQREVQERFSYVLVPEAERPAEARTLEQVICMLATETLLLNANMYNSTGRGKPPIKLDFARDGSRKAGVPQDVYKKIFDLIAHAPLHTSLTTLLARESSFSSAGRVTAMLPNATAMLPNASAMLPNPTAMLANPAAMLPYTAAMARLS